MTAGFYFIALSLGVLFPFYKINYSSESSRHVTRSSTAEIQKSGTDIITDQAKIQTPDSSENSVVYNLQSIQASLKLKKSDPKRYCLEMLKQPARRRGKSTNKSTAKATKSY